MKILIFRVILTRDRRYDIFDFKKKYKKKRNVENLFFFNSKSKRSLKISKSGQKQPKFC